MTNYENRLLKFLKAHPTLLVTTEDIASMWKRSEQDIRYSVSLLLLQKKLKHDRMGHIMLKGGIGGA